MREPPKRAPSPEDSEATITPTTIGMPPSHDASCQKAPLYIKVSGLNENAMVKINRTYMRKEANIAQKVPPGMAVAGSRKSPDRLDPTMIPVTAGKMIENTCNKSHGW